MGGNLGQAQLARILFRLVNERLNWWRRLSLIILIKSFDPPYRRAREQFGREIVAIRPVGLPAVTLDHEICSLKRHGGR